MSLNYFIHTLVVTPIQQNCRILQLEKQTNCLIFDPGGDPKLIINFLEKQKLIPTQIWLTHSHLDHCGGVFWLKEKYNLELFAHSAEGIFRKKVEESSRSFGIAPGIMTNCPEPDVLLDDKNTLIFEGLEWRCLYTPGHSPGHVSFYEPTKKILIAGDTLFAGSIGRTDLPGGNHKLLLDSIKTKIFTLPQETKVLSGHGPDTTIAVEKATNPFLI